MKLEFRTGRLIDHVHLRVADLEKSRKFYAAIADCLGIDSFQAFDGHFSCDELFVSPADGEVSRVHVAFQARNRDVVDKFHKVALANGGTDNGKPGERSYHPGYYAAFVLDPDGHNIEAVNHGPVKRSADAVIQTAMND